MLAGLALGTAVLHGQAQAPAELARLVQARYDTVQDFEGEFTQTYEGGVLRTKTTERGTVVIKRPGKMRWVYTAPERKEFVSDGTKIYAYFPADKQVMVSAAPTGADTTPALFLTGQANLVRDFEASTMELPGALPGTLVLKLVARKARPGFRVAGGGRGPRDLPDPAAGRPGPAGRAVDVHFPQPEGKSRVRPITHSSSAFRRAWTSSTMTREPADRLPARSLAVLLAACLLAGACATVGALSAARTAEQNQDYDLAVAEYIKAARERPDDRGIRLALDRAKLRASQDHVAKARRHLSTGHPEEAMMEFQLAAELNPGNGEIQTEMRALRTQLRTQVAAANREGQTTLETLIKESLAAPLPGQDVPTDVTLPDTLIFREASARDIFTAIGKFANLSVVFDPAFRDQPVSIDLRQVTIDQALTSLASSTRNFWRVTAPRTVAIVPDTAAKRREYEEEVVRTFFLSNADLKETVDVLRIVVDARRIAPIGANNAITIKDTPERVAAAGRIITAIDKARPEVVIDVELLEVDRTRMQDYGLQVASPGSPGIDGSATIIPNPITLRDLSNLNASGVVLTNLPGLFYRLLKTDSNTRIAGQPAAAHLGGHRRPGALRRARAGAGHHVRADRRRRRADAADHLVQLREHRRQHRHHAAHAP